MTKQRVLRVEIPDKIAETFRHKSRYKVFAGGRGAGKCFGVDTPILMYDGTVKAVQDVQVGDQVMGPDSKPRTVLNLARGESELYRVKQTSAMDYVVNKDHILSLKKSLSCAKDVGNTLKSGNVRRPRGRYPDWPAVTNISVADYLNKSHRWKEHFRGYRAGLIEFPDNDVYLDPYFLGIWLGDGTTRSPDVTTADFEVSNFIHDFASDLGLRVSSRTKPNNKASTYAICGTGWRNNHLLDVMRWYGLIGNKHIPQEYIANNESVRLQLLAGLIDSDGTYDGKGSYNICQVNAALAEQIKLLADTLGFRTGIRTRKTVCHNNGVVGAARYVSISGSIWRIPCRIARKRVTEDMFNPNKDKMLSYIKLEELGIGKYYGFEVDGDHLFCLADGTVTHNSHSIARVLLARGVQERIRVLCARETQKSIADSVHKLLADTIREWGLEDFYEIQKATIIGKNGTEFIFSGLRDASGVRSTEAINICWVEEADSVSEESWEKLTPTIRAKGSEIWIVFNPQHEDDPVYRRFITAKRKDTIVCWVNYYDNPWFPDVLRDEMLADRAANYANYLHVWEGQCKQTTEGAVFNLSWFKRHGRIFPDHVKMTVHSWDTAYKAKDHNDPSVCTIWKVSPSHCHLVEVVKGRWEYPELKARVIELADRDRPDAILIEDKASGQSLLQEMLLDTAHPVIAIKPDADKETRARAVTAMIESGRVTLPKEAEWLAEFEKEIAMFPNEKYHDDQVDSMSQFLRWYRTRTSGVIKQALWNEYEGDEFPKFEFVVGSLHAQLLKAGLSSMSVWGVYRDENAAPRLMLMNCWEKRLPLSGKINYDIPMMAQQPMWGIIEWVDYTCKTMGVKRLLIDSQAAGATAANELRRLLITDKLRVQTVYPDGDKIGRMNSVQHIWTDGMIFAPDRKYAAMAIDRCSVFPEGDSAVANSISMALIWLREARWALRKEESALYELHKSTYRKPSEAIYDI